MCKKTIHDRIVDVKLLGHDEVIVIDLVPRKLMLEIAPLILFVLMLTSHFNTLPFIVARALLLHSQPSLHLDLSG